MAAKEEGINFLDEIKSGYTEMDLLIGADVYG